MPRKFHQLSPEDRLSSLPLSEDSHQVLKSQALTPEIANNLTENQISEIEIPLGICFIQVDSRDYTVPMASEEPSVLAAANNGSRIAGNFTTLENDRLMTGQIVFHQVEDFSRLISAILTRKQEIFEIAKMAYPSIYKRGGGLVTLACRQIDSFLSVDFQFDSQEAMGANMINTILEAIADEFRHWFPQEKVLFAILSNLTACQTTVETRIPLDEIGLDLAEKISLAATYAQLDPSRAATHNKGIMNGVEAVLLATGNDYRAVNAGIYTSAGAKGLSTWQLVDDELVGRITLPLAIATTGGATQVLPKAKASYELLDFPNAKTLASIIASVGLANNLAALKAIVSTGIQKGHMRLQARSLAIAAGAKESEIAHLADLLRQTPTMDLQTAKTLLSHLRKE